ncbi:hypothetical protein GSI_12823 [Ganoderma sinense ZZ0214-1]|uniref:Uncharacterized protein n=1 Tax=Ganoderma sinense ZZ0214-1 TaxID=1077348 RepID=A0A2G8RTU4_9APHY|nr:hypothetical protein GSI_12823 [Ganoderma sinense ZZ0214-1]
MSVITLNQAIVPTIWPGELGRIAASRFDKQVRSSWRFVPESSTGLHHWALVIENENDEARAGERHLVYAPDIADPTWSRSSTTISAFDVAIILHGFVSEVNLSPLGTWSKELNRKANNAPSAKQTLSLVSGGCNQPFGAQQQTLSSITEFIALKIGLRHYPAHSEDEINLERQVFTKIKNPSTAKKPSSKADDIAPYVRDPDMWRQWSLKPLQAYNLVPKALSNANNTVPRIVSPPVLPLM